MIRAGRMWVKNERRWPDNPNGWHQLASESVPIVYVANSTSGNSSTRSGKLTGKVKEPILGREAKVEALNRLVATLGITHRETLAVGDGANDLGMIRLSGMGVALHAKPAVAAEAEISINHGDLESLLYLQGYREDEIVFPN